MQPLSLLFLAVLAWVATLGKGQQEAPRPNVTRPVFLCGGDLTADSGYIASEGFPNYYPHNKKCTWTITVPEGQIVMLSFRVFDMEPDPTCRYDYLDVYNGHSVTMQRLGRFCGTFRPGAVLSTSNKMMLEMGSDEATNGRGFLAWYMAGLPHVDDQQFCGGKMEKPEGNLRTPNWPDSDYPAGISCSWHIIAPQDQIIELTFGKFDVELDASCRYDYVAVFNGGETDNTRRIGKFCGDTSPSTIYSDANELLVQFVSDLSVVADGFTASYTTKPAAEKASVTRSKPTTATAQVPKPVGPKPVPGQKPKATIKPATQPKHIDRPKPTRNEKAATKAPKTKVPSSVPTKAPAKPPAKQCPQRCQKKGTLQSNFCSSEFVVTGTVKTLAKVANDNSLYATVSIINSYKVGNLNVQQAGKTMNIKIVLVCPRCPILKRGGSYIFMGRVDEVGRGQLEPESFVVLYKPEQQQVLTSLSKRRC
ncbi:procollagen C-endopeptidase enhancer 1 [Microcaecilia unicolor]|uniref:Procollagen C-endopeptidase enhancer 2-like n=1 Tax=Microcaecilia unicolor TaxID=1415580 RepID=A0A6P7WQK8_9AMPH|nr:procollagen C-endopeptidase enhancer 2-like [Microcaecilia unicolor]